MNPKSDMVAIFGSCRISTDDEGTLCSLDASTVFNLCEFDTSGDRLLASSMR